MVMESSEEDEDYLAHEWITPQSSVSAAYQSHTEKGIRQLCSELLELKDAVENLCGNMQSKYLAFLRLSEEAVEVEHELITLQKHVSAQGMFVQDLMSGVSSQLEVWKKLDSDPKPDPFQDLLSKTLQDPKPSFLDSLDALLAEHRIEEALQLVESKDKEKEKIPTTELQKRKEILEEQIVSIAEQPSLSITGLKNSLSGLIRLNKGVLAHQLLLKAHGSRLTESRLLSPLAPFIPKLIPPPYPNSSSPQFPSPQKTQSLYSMIFILIACSMGRERNRELHEVSQGKLAASRNSHRFEIRVRLRAGESDTL